MTRFLVRRWPATLGMILLAAALARLTFLRWADLPLESDEAIVGLMARHVLYLGERPTFYYGQSYLGPLEPFTAALAFFALSPTLLALRLAPLLFSLLFVAFTIAVARRAFGPVAGVVTAIYLALPPLFLLTWSLKARGGYAELIGLGAVLLWLTLDLTEYPVGRGWRWAVLGALTGIALWTDPLAIAYVLPISLYLLLHLRARVFRGTTLLALFCAVAACLPMIVANLHSGGATFHELAGPNVSQPMTIGQYRHNLSAVLRISLPVLLGFFQATSNLPGFQAVADASRVRADLATMAGAVVALAMVAVLVRSIRRPWDPRPDGVDLLAWVGALTILLFTSSQVLSVHETEPRYLLPLYSLVPIGGAMAQRLWKARPGLAYGAIALTLAINLASWAAYTPDLAAPVLAGQVVRADRPALSELLVQRGDRAMYADYWIAYTVAFTSGERVVAGVIDDQLSVGFNRYIPYAIVADQSVSPAVVVVAGSPSEQRLRAWLAEHRARYEETRWQNLVIVDRIVPPFHPDGG